MFDHKTVAKALERPWSCPLLTNHQFGVGQLKHLAHPKDANSTRGVGGFGKNHLLVLTLATNFYISSWFYYYWSFLIIIEASIGEFDGGR